MKLLVCVESAQLRFQMQSGDEERSGPVMSSTTETLRLRRSLMQAGKGKLNF